MTRARSLSQLANSNVFSVDANNSRVGIGSTIPDVKLDVGGDLYADNLTINNLIGVAATFSGVVSYEDVTNVDSVGIITAQSYVSIADSIVHTGDTNTAIRFPEADTFTVETAGSERLRITSAGLVGIGSETPVRQLEVFGDRSAYLRLGSNRAGAGQDEFIGGIEFFSKDVSGPGAGVRGSIEQRTSESDGSGSNMVFRTGDGSTNNVERLRITSTGRVGINEISPDTLLHVRGADNVLATFESTDADSLIEFKDNGTSDTILIGALGGDDLLFRCDAGNIVFHTNNNTETIRVSAGGSFGIGTNNPDRMLSVSDQTNGKLARFIGPTNNLFIMNDRSGIIDLFSSGGGDDLCFGTSNTERFRIGSTGNVGFNTDQFSGNQTIQIAGELLAAGTSLTSQGLIFQPFTTAGTGDVYPGITWSGNVGALTRARASITAVSTGTVATASDLVFMTRSAADGSSLNVATDEKLRITSGGNVGIGSTIPSAKLDIIGGGDKQLQVTGGEADLWLKSTGPGNTVWRILGSSGTNTHKFRIYDNTNNRDLLNIIGDSKTYQFNNGPLVENGEVTATAASGTQNIDLFNGMVLYRTTNSSGTWKPNFRVNGSISVNSIMGTGDVISPTLIIQKGATTHYADTVQVDGSDITPEWLGGAPTAGGGSGTFDIYSYTIIKTADATFKVFGSVSTYE